MSLLSSFRPWRAVVAALALAAAAGLPAAWAAGAETAASAAPAGDSFLDPADAFRPQITVDGQAVQVTLQVAPGYHLYRERFSLQAEGGAALPPPTLPPGRSYFDTNFNQTMTLWEGTVQVRQALPAGELPQSLAMSYQGCADRGLCYPPQQGTVHLSRDADGLLQARWEPAADLFSAPPAGEAAKAPAPAVAATAAPVSDDAGNALALSSGSLLKVVPLFLLGGLLLSFTPCVLPMVPILSSIIVGQGAPVSRSRGFSLALAYSLGMAMVYTAAGVAAGLLGSGFAAALQNPWVLGSFALLLSVLSLSMFGLFELQMPSFIQARVNNASNKLGGGRHLAVFGMGGLSALLVGPCVAAPLAGALLYISQTRDVLLGGAALFALATGMSVPLLLLGLSAGSLLPRAVAGLAGAAGQRDDVRARCRRDDRADGAGRLQRRPLAAVARHWRRGRAVEHRADGRRAVRRRQRAAAAAPPGPQQQWHRRRHHHRRGGRAQLPPHHHIAATGRRAAHGRQTGDGGRLCRLVRFLQGDGTPDLPPRQHPAAAFACAAAAGRRDRQHARSQGADETLQPVRPAGRAVLRPARHRAGQRPHHRLRAGRGLRPPAGCRPAVTLPHHPPTSTR